MEKLVILSDLWGKKKSDWVNNYIAILKDFFDINFYDCCDLGKIDKAEMIEENLHQQFVNNGIETAVETLIQKEKEKINVLGFSVGGYIGWKASLKGLRIKNLIAISSTRLRYENEQPSCLVELYFGEFDKFKPDSYWLNNVGANVKLHIYKEEYHECYKKKEIAMDVCSELIKKMELNR